MNEPSRDEICAQYLDAIPYDPYPVQEEALLAWFTAEQGVLVCAPTGTGKTLIAEAAMFEALHTGKVAYYTTPLIALTEQKFQELQEAAVRWGFSADDVGLVTGNRRVNPDAKVLVVVAEILLNRLLHPEAFDFSETTAVVMDEFHSFNDPERGVVWELSLGLLPAHVRLLLLSATVGNSVDFLLWLRKHHNRNVELIQSSDRKVPLLHEWVEDSLLNEHVAEMCQGEEDERRIPSLIFCFNRNECWSVAEQLKGKSLLADGQQKRLVAALEEWEWKGGAGPKLKQLLMRGVGVHHAGLLPKYRRRVEELFQQKLLSVCTCTETLAAGINLPARSVVLTSLMKGPPGRRKLIDASTAHQIFGRAGRPQFDTQGYVHVLAHEDDVKIARWKRQYDQIPEDTKDPNLIKAKKRLKKKMPKRREGESYWNEQQFQKLIEAPSAKLASRGELPWRLLAYLLQLSPDVERLRTFVNRRLLSDKEMERAQQRLTQMLVTLWAGGFVELDPQPPAAKRVDFRPSKNTEPKTTEERAQPEEDFGGGLVEETPPPPPAFSEVENEPTAQPAEPTPNQGTFGALLQEAIEEGEPTARKPQPAVSVKTKREEGPSDEPAYDPRTATPTPELDHLLQFRSINPIYGVFLVNQLGIADRAERIQAIESTLDISGSIFSQVRVPGPEEIPPGPLATGRLDDELINRGLVTAHDLNPDEDDRDHNFGFERRYAVPLADKLKLLFDSEFPDVRNVRIRPVWIVGNLLHYGGDFNKYVTSRDLTKQEGLIFRHALRMILLCGEFAQLTPPDDERGDWLEDLSFIRETLTVCCRDVDRTSTDKMLEQAEHTAEDEEFVAIGR